MHFVWRELDWTTSSRQTRLKPHWRISLCVLLGIVASTLVWFSRTPHAFWFFILWVSLATGSFAGLIPGVVWQLSRRERWPETSGRFIVTSFLSGAVMSAVAVLLLAPALHNEEQLRQQFRSLSESDISSMIIDVSGRHFLKAEGAEAISAFASAAREATLLYRSHEAGRSHFVLRIEFKYGTSIACEGDVPERHVLDIALKCGGALAGEVLIPSGRKWLDEATGSQS